MDVSQWAGVYRFDPTKPLGQQTTKIEDGPVGPHKLETQAAELLETAERLEAEITSWKGSEIYTAPVKTSKIEGLAANKANYIAGTLRAMLETAQNEWRQTKAQRSEIIKGNRLSDPLNTTNGVERARQRIPGLARAVDNLGQFETDVYEAALSDDPYLAGAIWDDKGEIARRSWPGSAGVGSFVERLKADESDYYENDETRRIRRGQQLLYEGVKAATDAGRKLWRLESGVYGMGPAESGTIHAQLERLGWEIAGELGIGRGSDGGYVPAVEPMSFGG